MFSALKDGNIVHILNKRDKMTYSVGQIVSIKNSQFGGPMYNGQFSSGELTITIDVNGKHLEFGKVPANQNVVYYDNGNTVVSESLDTIVSEVRNAMQNSESILSTMDYHKSVKTDGEEILKTIDPAFAKEVARDKEINDLSKRMDKVDNTLDYIVSLLSKAETK